MSSHAKAKELVRDRLTAGRTLVVGSRDEDPALNTRSPHHIDAAQRVFGPQCAPSPRRVPNLILIRSPFRKRAVGDIHTLG